jgi:hypothetical protein
MVEKILSVIAAVGVPALGLSLRASRRSRLRQRIRENLEIANEVAEHDPAHATAFREVAAEASELLIAHERITLRKRFDPMALVAILLVVAPAIAIAYFAWDWDSVWRTPVVVVAIVWAVIWTAAGLTQLRKEHDAQQASEKEAS